MNFAWVLNKIFSKEGLMTILFVASGFFGLMFFLTKQNLKTERKLREQQKEIYEQNFFALSDTIKKTFNKKLDQFNFEKGAFVTTLDNLARYDEALAKQVKGMEGNLVNIIRSEIGGLLPPQTVDSEMDSLGDGNYALKWEFPYEDAGMVQFLAGKSSFRWYQNRLFPGKSTLDSNFFKLKLHMGFRELDDKYEIFATSQSPFVYIGELTGVTFIDKPPPFMPPAPGKRPFSVGPYFGWGANWDNKMQNPRFGLSMGIAIHYNIFSFGKPREKNNDNWFYKGTDKLLGMILEHKVEKNETLYSISAKYGLSTDKMKKLNNLTTDMIYPGQILWVSLHD